MNIKLKILDFKLLMNYNVNDIFLSKYLEWLKQMR